MENGGNKEAGFPDSTTTSAFWLSGELSASDIANSMMPEYPHSASSQGINTLTVTLDFCVDSNGNVRPGIAVAGTTGTAGWDEDVKNTLSRWKFKPAPGVETRKGTISFRIVRSKMMDE